MDPLSVTTAVVGILQAACSILSFCYSVRTEMRNIPWSLIQIIGEVRDLRNLIETIEAVLDKSSSHFKPDKVEASNELSDTITPVLSNCLAELQNLQNRIRPDRVDALLSSRRKAFLQSLSWNLGNDDAKESIKSLKRCKAALNLAINFHNL